VFQSTFEIKARYDSVKDMRLGFKATLSLSDGLCKIAKKLQSVLKSVASAFEKVLTQ
jgi:hypothetical protein